MRNLLLGFLIGVLIATGAGVWAQSTSGSVFTYPGTGMSTFSNSDGTSGSIYTYPGRQKKLGSGLAITHQKCT